MFVLQILQLRLYKYTLLLFCKCCTEIFLQLVYKVMLVCFKAAVLKKNSFKSFSGHKCVDQILCTSILQDHQTYFPHSLLTCSNTIWWVDIFWPPDMNQAVLIPSSQQDRRRQCTKKLIGQDKGRKINQEVPT